MPRAGLDAGIIVGRACHIVDADGLSSLTLSRVAREFGVATPSLYKHIDGLDDLVTRVAVKATEELADRLEVAVQGKSGRTALQALCWAYRTFAHEHPGTYPLTQHPRDTVGWQAAAADAVSCLTTALSGYGMRGDVSRVRFIRSALHGFVDLERSAGFRLPVSVDDSFTVLVDALDDMLRATAGGAAAATV